VTKGHRASEVLEDTLLALLESGADAISEDFCLDPDRPLDTSIGVVMFRLPTTSGIVLDTIGKITARWYACKLMEQNEEHRVLQWEVKVDPA